MTRIRIHLDMDGVLADFDRGLDLLGFHRRMDTNASSRDLAPEARLEKKRMYAFIEGTDFYAKLPLMADARQLFDACRATGARISILTASPKFGGSEGSETFLSAAAHKRAWIEEHFGPFPDEEFVCTVSERKAEKAADEEHDVVILIDDRPKNIAAWEAAGGIGVLHVSAAESLARLWEILPEDAAERLAAHLRGR